MRTDFSKHIMPMFMQEFPDERAIINPVIANVTAIHGNEFILFKELGIWFT